MKNKIISGRRFIRLIPYFTALTVLFFLLQCSEPELPGEVVKNFYSTYLTTTASGLPGEKDLQILKPFFTSKLGSLLVNALREQNDFINKFPDEKPPLIEGDLFSSLFEGPTNFKIADTKINDESATVFVEFAYPDSLSDEKVFKWQDAVHLILEGKKWKISDIEYLGKWDFALRGRLTEILNSD
ncbi:MAG: hypothetical protein A2057_01165 [Ignavibacteria bacterium GWA2_35_9]|nr:MAG: hypothetical protein A2057_01165 [Ignavibacteria bacterium GWA2_35_9]OGU50475.1 MAG: hypothetical protein A2080_11420 [Ignavibacteria bacterium GWC2_36_12]